ncbi:endonuclease/exonuclease/phosphatase family protein [Acuticoccus kandeliae]|uniref:endonuclease/exonuclease/phosphatase family protein n=1 Tax=Acuticoccus kandeliae TaxID=2073160 RepID=UPI000D3E798C|nr:endonuclease/exonuclease/phosphatase family protein [Acuticoccus kandeliae]
MGKRAGLALLVLVLALAAGRVSAETAAPAPGSIRFATFNAALTEDAAGGLLKRLSSGIDPQARRVAEVIQRVRPDVLVLQEIDRDAGGESLTLFVDTYLARGEQGAAPIDYPFRLFPPSNTGVLSGADLDGDGTITRPGDAKGFGRHEGQYAFAILSHLPLGPVRTYANLLWADMPGSLVPTDYYSPEARRVLPLSSKTHIVVPVETGAGEILLLAAHPTPPVFDDPVHDWNGRRNADEIRLLADLLDGAVYLVDDSGETAPLPAGAAAIVAGDLNADPARGDSRPGAIDRLLSHPRLVDPVPASPYGDATADFSSGRMRVDYVLPTRGLDITGAGVFWPAAGDPLARLDAASDHHLVYVDVRRP